MLNTRKKTWQMDSASGREPNRDHLRQGADQTRQSSGGFGSEHLALGATASPPHEDVDSSDGSSTQSPQKAKARKCDDAGYSDSNLPRKKRKAGSSQLFHKLAEGATENEECQSHSGGSTDLVVAYAPYPGPVESPLSARLRQCDPELFYNHYFRSARYVMTDVGPCASDLIWRWVIDGADAVTLTHDVEAHDSYETASKDKVVKTVVKEWVFARPDVDPHSENFNVTPKFATLVSVLKAYMTYGTTFRGIVFVQRRATAKVMAEMLSNLDEFSGFIRAKAIVGHGAQAVTDNQHEVFRDFESGRLNLIVVTKTVEQLELPKACLVVRFDLFDSHTSYSYARNCAGGSQSRVVHMAEAGNNLHRRIIFISQDMSPGLRLWLDETVSGAGAFPPSDLVENADPYRSDSEDEDEIEQCVKDPTTNAHIFRRDAITVVHRLGASLTSASPDVSNRPLVEPYSDAMDQKTSDRHTHPLSSLLSEVSVQFSGPSSTVNYQVLEDRPSICFRACARLSDRGLLDYRLFPRPRPMMPHAEASEVQEWESSRGDSEKRGKPKKLQLYPQKSPTFWRNNSTHVATRLLFPLIIDVQGGSLSFSRITILTRAPLPDMETTKVFLQGVPAEARLIRASAITVDEEKFDLIYRYSMRMLRAVMNKPLVCNIEDVPYFIAPLRQTWHDSIVSSDLWNLPDVLEYIPWEQVASAADHSFQSLDIGHLEDEIVDAVVLDRRMEFTRRYEVVAIRHDLTPLSKPADFPRLDEYGNFVEWAEANVKNFEGLQDYKQPILQVCGIPAVDNCLNSMVTRDPGQVKRAYLVPELSGKFSIPASTFRTACVLPSIAHYIHCSLLAKELNAQLFDHTIAERHLLRAITPPSACVEYDYQRLELLGDAFIKFLSTVYIFATNAAVTEGSLHNARRKLLTNQSLYLHALSVGLPQFIQSKPLVARLWMPPNFQLSPSFNSGFGIDTIETTEGEGDKDADSSQHAPQPVKGPSFRPQKRKSRAEAAQQLLGDKVIADIVEAIIGAAYLSGGNNVALRAAKALHIPIDNIYDWSDFYRAASPAIDCPVNHVEEATLEAVEGILGLKVKRPELLAQALIHGSMYASKENSYERLEFLGDAVLELLAVEHVFHKESQLPPGALTSMKIAMVSNATFAAICVSTGLHRYVAYDNAAIAKNIEDYIKELNEKKNDEYRLAESEGRSPGQYWLNIETPKILSDVIESIFGALFVSDGFNRDSCETVFTNVLRPFYDKHISPGTLSVHPVTALCELLHAYGCTEFETSKYQTDAEHWEEGRLPPGQHQVSTCEVIVHNTILSSCAHASAGAAARFAAFWALDAIEGDPGFMRAVCDCRSRQSDKKAAKKSAKPFSESAGNENKEVGK